MKKVIELLEVVRTCVRRGRRDIPLFLTSGEVAEINSSIDEAIAKLQAPRFYTPERWEAETGKPWPDNGAMYFRHKTLDGGYVSWALCDHKKYKRYVEVYPFNGFIGVCATEAGPPPDDWRSK
jgi:hypothetical protein